MLCGAVRADWETETTKKTQWLINVFPNIPQTHSIPSPCMTEHNWSKSKLNYIHSSIYKKIPSTLYVCYSRKSQKIYFKKGLIPRGTFILFFLCHHYKDFWSIFVSGMPCKVTARHRHMCTNTTVPTVLLYNRTSPHISFPVGAFCPAVSPRLQTIVLPQVLCSAINSKGTCGGHRPALKSLVWKV